MIKLAALVSQASLQMSLGSYVFMDSADNEKGIAELDDPRHSRFPDMVLKCSLDNYRDPAREILAYDVKKEVGNGAIDAGRKLTVLDPVGVDITLFDLIPADDRHPQFAAKFPGQRRLTGPGPACDDDALWFSVHG